MFDISFFVNHGIVAVLSSVNPTHNCGQHVEFLKH